MKKAALGGSEVVMVPALFSLIYFLVGAANPKPRPTPATPQPEPLQLEEKPISVEWELLTDVEK